MEGSLKDAAFDRYHTRMRRVLDHIDRHLDDDLRLDTLSGVAAFSRHHFHRQFTAIFGISVHRYVRLARIKRASYRLAFREDEAITDIALDARYASPEAFARAFRQRIGQAPSEFRKAPDWRPWRAALDPFTDARTMLMTGTYIADDVSIVETDASPVAMLAHRGDPAQLGDTIRRFIAWRRAVGLRPNISATFNIFHTDPLTTSVTDFHVDLCAATRRTIVADGDGIVPGLIPGGRCAVLRVVGSSDNLEPAASYLYRDWLPASGEEPRDFPFYCRRVLFFPDVLEHEAVTDLYLPLR